MNAFNFMNNGLPQSDVNEAKQAMVILTVPKADSTLSNDQRLEHDDRVRQLF